MQWTGIRDRLRPRSFFCAGLGVALLAVPGLARSATLDVVDGKLMGAYNVVVPTHAGSKIYNVKFIDGYCGEVFTGCGGTIGGGTYPFAFDVGPAGVFPWDLDAVARVAADTRAAAQALLEQVFIDSELGRFDSEHRLTNGCVTDITTGGCNAIIPFGVQHRNFSVWATAAGNAPREDFDAVSVGGDQVIDYVYKNGIHLTVAAR